MANIIGIDVYSALHSPRGMGIYTINILKEIAKLDKENTYILYADVEDKNNVLPLQNNFIFKKLDAKSFIQYEQVVLPRECKKDNINILHSPADTSPVFLDKKIKRIITLHDVIFLKSLKEIPLPNNKKQILGRIYYCLTTLLNTKKAKTIFTVSNYSKDDISKTLKINKEKIVITSNGHEHFDISQASSIEELKCKYNIPNDYFFHLGGEAPSKNTKFLLEYFVNNQNENIVVAGIKDLENSRLAVQYSKYANIYFVPYISKKDLVGIYKNAKAFLFSSLYEGFGIPLLEAMKCFCPIISSNSTCLPEIAGNTAIYFNPKNKTDLENAINNFNKQERLNVILEHTNERLNYYSWSKTSKIILNTYLKLFEKGTENASL